MLNPNCRKNNCKCECHDENEITLEELKSLQNYFLKAGYINHEFHEDIHLLLRKIDNILKESTDLK